MLTTQQHLKRLYDLAAISQAHNTVLNHILLELATDIARTKQNPEKFASDVFEGVISRIEKAHGGDEARPVNLEERFLAETFFSLVRRRLTRRRK